MKIYSMQFAKGFKVPFPCTDKDLNARRHFNTGSLLNGWEAPSFEFKEFDCKNSKVPDISCLGAGLAFRADLKNKIFPNPCKELEFLPIRVSECDWLVVNCLKTTSRYDREESVLYRRGERDQVFMIIHLIVTDPTLEKCELFVIDDSNRTTLFVLPSLIERINALGLKGLVFKDIGVLERP